MPTFHHIAGGMNQVHILADYSVEYCRRKHVCRFV